MDQGQSIKIRLMAVKTSKGKVQTEWLIRIQLRMCYLVSIFLTVPV